MKLFLITILACGLLLGGCKDEVATTSEAPAPTHETTAVEHAEHMAADVVEQAQHAAAEAVDQATDIAHQAAAGAVSEAEAQVADAAEQASAKGSEMVDGLLNGAADKEEEGGNVLSSAVQQMNDMTDSPK